MSYDQSRQAADNKWQLAAGAAGKPMVKFKGEPADVRSGPQKRVNPGSSPAVRTGTRRV
jgi:hypothetical protein